MNAHTIISAPLHWCPKCSELDEPIVYAIDDIQGELVGVITDALTGYSLGTFRTLTGHSFDAYIGTPLCPYCENPVSEAVPLTDVVRLSAHSVIA